MKITFFSNFINHHQMPLCNSFSKLLNDNYKFVAMEDVPEEKITLGYPSDDEAESYYVPSFKNEELIKYAELLSDESDVVIVGDAPDKYIKHRLKKNKLTFRYKERIIKNGINIKTIFRIVIGIFRHFTIFQNKPLYILCASAYTPCDINRFANYTGRYFKWGYFPETIEYNIGALMEKKQHNKISILWVGRLIDFKRPEDIIDLAIKLKNNNIQFEINIIGTGVLEEKLKNLIQTNLLEDYCFMLGAKPQREVRKYMEEANIFVFTSDFGEGWGAVLNEAMNSGCASVVSHAIGAAPYLIKHNYNGLIYKFGDNEMLFDCVRKLIVDNDLRTSIGVNAYNTIKNNWNSDIAAKRFITLCECINNGSPIPFNDGPCSIAPIINQNDMYDYILNMSEKQEI